VRTIFVLRHAKSDWNDPSLDDFDRPLAPRGLAAAPRIGRFLRDRGFVPERVLCSTAARARATWNLVAKEIGTAPAAELSDALYLAPKQKILAMVRALPDDCASVLVVGHNPGLHDLVLGLAGAKSNAKLLKRIERGFPTAAFAVLVFDVDRWRNVADYGGRLETFVRPKSLDSTPN
jgi:phosphohistidine phosphatase